MRKIGLTTSPDRTASTPENIGATIEEMAHDISTIWLWVPNVLFSSIVIKQKFLLSGHIRVYYWEIYVKGKLTRLTGITKIHIVEILNISKQWP